MKYLYFTFLFCANVCIAQTDTIVGYWNFDDQIIDVGINNLSSINNGVTLVEDRFGNQTSAGYFDGNSSILVEDFTSVSISEITYSFWVKMEDLTSSGSAILQGTNHHTITIGHYINNTSFVPSSFFAGLDNTSLNNDMQNDPSPNNIIVEDEWFFLTATNDGNITKLYINGILESQYNETLTTNIGDLTIGDNTNTSKNVFLKGTIDDLKIYSRALSDSEILSNYSQSTPIKDINNSKFVVNIFPNPTNGKFLINFESNVSSVNLSIKDITGRLIQSKYYSNIELLNISLNEAPGVYILSLSSKTNKTAKFFLIKN